MLKLFFNEIRDIFIRQNFERLSSFVLDQGLLHGEFSFFQVTFIAAATNFKFKHNLGFQPKDIIQTSITGVGALTFNYSKFDQDFIDITTTGACVVRFFAGSYKDGDV